MKGEPAPTVGSVVHYVSYGTPGGEYTSQCRAAIVTETTEDPDGYGPLASLCVLNPEGQFFNRHLRQDPTGTVGGTWHWPEAVR